MTIKWSLKVNSLAAKQVGQYKIMIFNLSDNLLFEEKTSKTYMIIDLSKTKTIMEEKILVLKVIPLDKSDKELVNPDIIDGDAIVIMEEYEKQQITQELNTIFKDQNRETAFGKLVEARFFEDKKLYIDAINAYEEALKLSFEPQIYSISYRYFLERNNLW